MGFLKNILTYNKRAAKEEFMVDVDRYRDKYLAYLSDETLSDRQYYLTMFTYELTNLRDHYEKLFKEKADWYYEIFEESSEV